MFKEVYRKKDGKPVLFKDDLYNNHEVNLDKYTNIQPPRSLYYPIQFDDKEKVWIGISEKDWLDRLPKGNDSDDSPDPSALQMAQTQMQVAESSFQLRDTQKQLAQSMLDIAEKDERIKQLEEQQAQVLLELVELKGEK